MKNTIKSFVVIALVAVIGFSFPACSNDSTSSSGKSYSGIGATLSYAQYYIGKGGIFSTGLSNGTFVIFSEEDDLETKAAAAVADADPYVASNLSEINDLLDLCISDGIITSSQKDDILYVLNTDGFCVTAKRRDVSDENKRVYILAFKED